MGSAFTNLLREGGLAPWLFIPSALLLGALHALEPGHSKGLMASFVVASRGTPGQASVLGLAAATSHLIIVWVLAVVALIAGDRLIGERIEPYLLIVSGVLVIGIPLFWYFRQKQPHGHDHSHRHGHDHDHHHGHDHDHDHGHDHAPIPKGATSRTVTMRQIVSFGFTAGLLPCPAAITVLILCLAAGEVWLGVAMVVAFSAGLALTLVAVGVISSLSARAADRRWRIWDRLGRYGPVLSVILMAATGILALARGIALLPA